MDVSQVPALTAALAGVAGTRSPFSLCLYGCHIFTDRCGGAPKIAWVGVGGQRHQLNLLQMAVGNAMDNLEYESAENHFLPHVTVGRFDTDDRNWCLEMSDYWCNMPFEATEAFLVNEVVLYASERDAAGRVAYVIHGRWALNADLLG